MAEVIILSPWLLLVHFGRSTCASTPSYFEYATYPNTAKYIMKKKLTFYYSHITENFSKLIMASAGFRFPSTGQCTISLAHYHMLSGQNDTLCRVTNLNYSIELSTATFPRNHLKAIITLSSI